MNEPSVFDGPEGTLPKNVLHYIDAETKVYHRDVHNMYGVLMTKATYNGTVSRFSVQPERPFVLTRSAFFGTQKFAAKWTGDNQATIDEVQVSIS